MMPGVVVAGHICLDIIPTISSSKTDLRTFLKPGTLSQIGPALLATGGAVSNTGLALHTLGLPTRLMGKVGDDPFGKIIRDLLESRGGGLGKTMITAQGEQTSYTIVISRPHEDRLFLHCPGANDTFGLNDLDVDILTGSVLFHLGYPPLMKRFYSDGGSELAKLFARVRASGLTTSLDMAHVDPSSDAAKTDWPALLKKVLPHVDLFLPSIDEIMFMMREDSTPTTVLLNEIAGKLISWGAAVVVLKLGDQGLFLRTTKDQPRLARMGHCKPADAKSWTGRQLLAPCFAVDVEGTTGAGDCTIAGFLAAFGQGQSAEEALISAVGAGACCVEKADATSGVPTWKALQARIAGGWTQRTTRFANGNWKQSKNSVLAGPEDQS